MVQPSVEVSNPAPPAPADPFTALRQEIHCLRDRFRVGFNLTTPVRKIDVKLAS